MKKLSVGLLIISLTLITGWSFVANTKDWNTIRSVTYGIGTEQEIICSATKVHKKHLLTASHCIVKDETEVIIVYNGDTKVGKAKYAASKPSSDLALLLITEGVEGPDATVSLSKPLQDELVVLAGYPLAEYGEVLTEGVWQSLKAISYFNNEGDVIERKVSVVSVAGTWGNSGGGLFVYRGFYEGWVLVGVTSQGVVAPVMSNFGEGWYTMLNFLVLTVSYEEVKDFLGEENEKDK